MASELQGSGTKQERVPPVLAVLGLAEVEQQPRNNRMRAL